MHVMDNSDLSLGEQDTNRNSKESCPIIAANGSLRQKKLLATSEIRTLSPSSHRKTHLPFSRLENYVKKLGILMLGSKDNHSY